MPPYTLITIRKRSQQKKILLKNEIIFKQKHYFIYFFKIKITLFLNITHPARRATKSVKIYIFHKKTICQF